MILKCVQKVQTLCATMTHVPKYNFGAFPSKYEKKFLQHKFYERYTDDDLRFPHQNEEINGGIQAVRSFLLMNNLKYKF